MRKLLLISALMLATTPAVTAAFTTKEVTDYDARKQTFFSPDAFDMDSLLIVDQLSKADATKNTGHQKVAEKLKNDKAASASGGIAATGKVVSVDIGNHTIKIKHDPIKALGWPVMTMTFTADKGVDLSSYKEGDAVSFTLKPAGGDDYTISTIKK